MKQRPSAETGGTRNTCDEEEARAAPGRTWHTGVVERFYILRKIKLKGKKQVRTVRDRGDTEYVRRKREQRREEHDAQELLKVSLSSSSRHTTTNATPVQCFFFATGNTASIRVIEVNGDGCDWQGNTNKAAA